MKCQINLAPSAHFLLNKHTPVGLYWEAALHCDDGLDIVGAKAAALTHTHELGYIPAAALVHIIDRIVHEDDTIAEAVDDAMARMPELFPQTQHVGTVVFDVKGQGLRSEKSLILSYSCTPDLFAKVWFS